MIALALFSLCLATQVLYLVTLRAGFRRAHGGAGRPAPAADPPGISVVLAARNEAENIPDLLNVLAAQDFPRFEVVIVDDGSTDATPELVRARSATDSRFHLVTVQPSTPRKKRALNAGISASRYDRLAFTDADCLPPEGWLSAIAAHAGDGDVIVLGYSPFQPEASSVNRVSRYETLVTGFLTAAAVGLGRPYMAVGRNLSYSRSTFDTIGGFAHSERSLSGDDDLLVQHAWRQGIRSVHMFGPGSQVPTHGPGSWSEWLRQKRRHASAGRYYTPSIKAHLFVYHATGHVLWLAPFLAGLPGIGLLAARLVILLGTLAGPARAFGERDLLAGMPLWELAYALYNTVIAPIGVAFAPRDWKTGVERSGGS